MGGCLGGIFLSYILIAKWTGMLLDRRIHYSALHMVAPHSSSLPEFTGRPGAFQFCWQSAGGLFYGAL